MAGIQFTAIDSIAAFQFHSIAEKEIDKEMGRIEASKPSSVERMWSIQYRASRGLFFSMEAALLQDQWISLRLVRLDIMA